MSMMTMILPSVFYLFLRASDEKRELLLNNGEGVKDNDNVKANFAELFKYVPKPILVLNCLSLTFGIVGGIVATVFSIKELTSYEVSAPCYVQYLKNGIDNTKAEYVNKGDICRTTIRVY
ncbi:unnamed protein product [Cylicostephanus goldi]|uniref:Amino acid transporter transmembrane domain-containing protein n=1 Tax=Cylicostephanus goldi TaxID=71465 RepID=A0A3P6SE32_CYLGO|nr:unnamed protein product [Cylicostephanus goldi]